MPAYEFRLPSYPSTAFPSLTTAHVGSIARDRTIGGIRMFSGTDWVHEAGEVVNVKAFGAKGDGVTDDIAAIEAANAVLSGTPGTLGTLYFPHTNAVGIQQTIYRISRPLVVQAGRHYVAAGHGSRLNGVTLAPTAGFTDIALIKDSLWATNIDEWFHWGVIENFQLDCENIVDYGIAIHQMGEESLLRRVSVHRGVQGGYLLTGAHAPATLELCSAWSTPKGVRLTQHPDIATLPLKTGNSGVVRLIGFSGDGLIGGGNTHIYADGAQKISVLGVKSEAWNSLLTWEGSATGGAAGTAVLSGYANVTAETDLIKIGGTAHPILVLAGLHSSGYTNWINDSVKSVTLATATYNQLQGLILYNGTSILRPTELVLEVGLKGKRGSGALATILQLTSGDETQVRGGAAGDGAVGGTGGVGIRAADGTLLAHFRATSNGGIDISQRIDLADDLVISSGKSVNGSVRRTLGPWSQDNVAASQTAVTLNLYGDTTRSTRLTIRAGSITGIVVRSNEARTAGTLTIEVTKNGVGTGLQAILDATNTTFKATTQATGLDTYVAGDEIGVTITTDAGWLPVSADISTEVEVVE